MSDSHILPKLWEAGIETTDELCRRTGNELLQIIDAHELIEVADVLRKEGRALTYAPGVTGWRIPTPRDMEMLRLRLLCGLTFKQIGESYGVTLEIPRRRLRDHFGVTAKQG